MSTGTLRDRDPDDFFAETRMSFGDHIEDLRFHLFRAIAGFLVALVFSFFIGKPVLEFIKAPVKAELSAFNNRRLDQKKLEMQRETTPSEVSRPSNFSQLSFRHDQLKALLEGKSSAEVNAFKKPVVVRPKPPGEERPWWQRWIGFASPDVEKPTGPDEEPIDPDVLVTLWVRYENPADTAAGLLPAIREVGDFNELSTLNVTEAFMVYFKVCILCGVVLGSPVIFYQIWAFVAAGLYPTEKRLVHFYLPISLGLFLAGVFMCEIWVIPKAIEALLWFNEWIGLKPDLRLNEWLSFALLMPLVFGASFQTPLVMMFLAKIGVMTAESFRSYRKVAWFVLLIVSAIIVPSPDAMSLLMLWVPLSLLYEAGIVLISLTPQPVPEMDESDTFVEV